MTNEIKLLDQYENLTESELRSEINGFKSSIRSNSSKLYMMKGILEKEERLQDDLQYHKKQAVIISKQLKLNNKEAILFFT